MAEILINQGRYIKSVEPVCGTNGLTTCVGVAIYHGKWFIAHIDCNTLVKSRTDPKRALVAEYVKNRLNYLLGPCGSPNVHIIGGFGDFSAWAIRDGVRNWVNDEVEIIENNFDGFKIEVGGDFVRLNNHEENNNNGDGDFTVPEL